MASKVDLKAERDAERTRLARRRMKRAGFYGWALLVAGGCAHGAPTPAPEAPSPGVEVDLLREKLAERDEIINQLESRLSLVEAEQRQLRYALADLEAARSQEPVPAPQTKPHPESTPSSARRTREEPRPLLRLYNDEPPRTAHIASHSLEPVPVVEERLSVVPLPVSLPAAPSARAQTQVGGGDPYVAGLDRLRKRDFAGAVASFERFLADFPGDGRAGRAQFWRGDALFVQRDYRRALSAFESSLRLEPRGDKAAEALLKIAMCHRRLGSDSEAQTALDRLMSQFPNSDAARLAQREGA